MVELSIEELRRAHAKQLAEVTARAEAAEERLTWDISSAPRDGTRVLLFDEEWCCGWWESYFNKFVRDGLKVILPTHWQPLPDDPK
jgi:hypothetical protein